MPQKRALRWLICGATTAALVAVLALWLGAAEAPPGITEFNSRYCHVHTNLNRDDAQILGQHMDEIFAEYDRRFAAFPVRSSEPMQLYVFRTREQYLAFLKQHNIIGTNSGGMFVVTRGLQALVIWAQGRPPSQVFTTMQHEGFHQFAYNRIGPNLPIWLNEGLAQYFEEGILVNGTMTLGRVDANRLASAQAAIKAGKVIDFGKLLAMSNREWIETLTGDLNTGTILYDQAWAIVHFLIHANGGKYRPALDVFLTELGKDTPQEEAFRKAFGSAEAGPFRQRWEQYMRTLQPDPISTAMARMEFLGQSIRFLQKRGETAPQNIEDLHNRLAQLGYHATRTERTVHTEFDGRDNAMYEYTLPNGKAAKFELLPSRQNTLPPGLAAPGLSPHPVVVWFIGADNQPMLDFEFK